ncbi:MAG: hypothetical protein FD153_1313 [Rhodospirillaceae bacterium]|nr:MAG: hypothetical protein FD153_1313 [Rhodospirillaceae bacterium]
MTGTEDLKEQLKKLNARATKLKMDLYNLSDNIQVCCELIMDVV